MVQGQDDTVNEASLPSLTPIVFCEWSKIYIVWRYFDERWRLYDLPVLSAFPWFLCPISLAGDSKHSNWYLGSLVKHELSKKKYFQNVFATMTPSILNSKNSRSWFLHIKEAEMLETNISLQEHPILAYMSIKHQSHCSFFEDKVRSINKFLPLTPTH